MTRLQLIQSVAYLQFISLPNDIKCRIAAEYKLSGDELFPDWKVNAMGITNAGTTGATPVLNNVFIGTVSNSAPSAGSITQTMYFLFHI